MQTEVYKNAKYKFVFEEPEYLNHLFEAEYKKIVANLPKYEEFEYASQELLQLLITNKSAVSPKVHIYGKRGDVDIERDCYHDEIIQLDDTFPIEELRNYVIGFSRHKILMTKVPSNVKVWQKRLHWTQFTTLPSIWWGRCLDINGKMLPSAASALTYCRQTLLNNLRANSLLDKYDYLYITRCDTLYTMPMPDFSIFPKDKIWFPDGEGYGGYCDRHAVVPIGLAYEYLGLLEQMVSNSWKTFMAAIPYARGEGINPEKQLKLQLSLSLPNETSIGFYPFIGFLVRPKNGPYTTWSEGQWNPKLNLFLKYPSEFKMATEHEASLKKSGLSVDEYFKKNLKA
jgi:hypothetical protein